MRESFRIMFRASRAYWLVNLVNFGDGIAYFGILNLLTLFIHDQLGLTDTMTGVAVSVFTGAVTLFMFFGGFVSDRLGVRKALMVSLLFLLLGRIFLTSSPLFDATGVLLWTSLALMALGTGVLQPSLYAGAKEFSDPRTSAISYSLIYAIMNFGIVIESYMSPFIRERGGIEAVFWTMAAVNGVVLVAILLLFTRKVEDRDRVVHIEPPRPEHATLKQKLKALPILDARFMAFIFILLPVRTMFAHQWLTMPHYIMRCFPESVGARYEWFQGLNPLIITVAVPLVAALTRKVDIIFMMVLGTVISAAATFILAPAPDLTLLITYIFVFSIGEAIWSSRFFEYIADLAPAGRVGAYMGLAGIPWFFAKFTTGFYSGFMLEKFIPEQGAQDSGALWMIYGVIALISPLGLLVMKKWMVGRTEASGEQKAEIRIG
ncbi:MFS transporter [candidate division KSB1 bacterium]|nr:MFS transporter [candidate division KSB1 bacterium]